MASKKRKRKKKIQENQSPELRRIAKKALETEAKERRKEYFERVAMEEKYWWRR